MTPAPGATLSPRRQRMRDKGAVDGDEAQALDLTLREQHPVERIGGRRLRFDGSERVALVDRDNPDAEAIEKLGQGAEIDASASACPAGI